MIGQFVDPSKSQAFFLLCLVWYYTKYFFFGHLRTKILSVCITKILYRISGSEQILSYVQNQKMEKKNNMITCPKVLYNLSLFSFYLKKKERKKEKENEK